MAKGKLPTNKKGNVPIQKMSNGKYRLTYYPDGARKRINFDTEDEAQKEWKRHKRIEVRYGKHAAEYDHEAHVEYSEAKRLVDGEDLRKVAKFWHDHHAGIEGDMSVKDAIARFLEQKDNQGRSERHQNTLKSHLDIFAKSFSGKSIKTVQPNHILEWLLGLKHEPRTIWNYHNSLCNLFNWCERRNLVKKAPTASIADDDLPTVPKKPKGVLTVEQTSALMTWLENNRPYFIPWYALQLFAGVRNAEAKRFQWNWVNFDNKVITIPGWVLDKDGDAKQGTKTQDDWAMHSLPENLFEWLTKYRGEGDKVRAPSSKAIERMRNHFKDKEQIDPVINPWPNNAMRHTFCTMLISIYQSADKVALWSRHTNTRQLYKSYVAKLLPKEDAEKYLDIKPN